VRLLFQPAEEVVEGALTAMGEGAITGVDRIFALHCDPRFETGQIGLRTGPITGACDKIKVRVSGPGGHTARPHLTADLVYALGKIVTELPAALSRRVDPRSSLSLVWGRISAGLAPNAIPEEGFAAGTVRCLDEEAWHQAPDLLKGLVSSVASAYGVIAELDYVRGVPPAVNDGESVRILGEAAELAIGPDAVAQAPQSLGGEDVAWYLESIPGALARLGIRGPETPTDLDIHQPNFDVDERAIGVGVRLMAASALIALTAGSSAPEEPVASTRGAA
jgi:amidohydrolase